MKRTKKVPKENAKEGVTYSLNFMKRKTLSFLLLTGLISVFAGCGGTGPMVRPSTGTRLTSVTGATLYQTPQTLYHVVGPAETLWRISKTYDVDINTLLKANNLDDPTKIKKGQKLVVPNTMGPRPVIPLYPAKRWTHIVIHHTATHTGDAFSIDQLHHQRGFWNGLGYHFLIDNGTEGKADGQIQVGPRWIKQQDGAHANAAGMNEHGIGIVLVGNFSETRVTQRELDSLVFLVKTLQSYYRISSANVIRHNDVPGKNTECPGNNFPWADFKRRLS